MGKKDSSEKRPENLSRCVAMIDAGIANANNQEGISFCTGKCPYDRCILFEGGVKYSRDLRYKRVKRMMTNGMKTNEIAQKLGVSTRTVNRILAEKK